MVQKDIYIKGLIGVEIFLKDVKSQVGNNDYDELIIHIDSAGGYVNEGMSIYHYIKGLENTTTIAENQCASIASIIFLSGKKRLIENKTDFMVHNPWIKIEGNANDLEIMVSELRKVEDELKKIYMIETGIDINIITKLLDEETFLDDIKLKDFGFVNIEKVSENTEKVEIFASLKKDINIEIMLKENNKTLLTKISDFFSNLLLDDDTTIKNNIKNMLKLTDTNGLILEFPELESTDDAIVGNKAVEITEVDGERVEKPADGDYLIPDERTFIFVSGELTEIKEKVVDEPEIVDVVLDSEALLTSLDVSVDGLVDVKFTIKEGVLTYEVGEKVIEEVEVVEDVEVLNLKKQVSTLAEQLREINAKIQSNFTAKDTNKFNEDGTKKERVIKKFNK